MKTIFQTLVLAVVLAVSSSPALTSALAASVNSDAVLSRRGLTTGGFSLSSLFKGSGASTSAFAPKPLKADFNRHLYYSTANKKYWQPEMGHSDILHSTVPPRSPILMDGPQGAGTRHIDVDKKSYALYEVKVGRLNRWRFKPSSNELHHTTNLNIMSPGTNQGPIRP